MEKAPGPITIYRLTDHAKSEMLRRGIGEDEVGHVLSAPEQTEPVREGREVYQSRFQHGVPPKTYLVRCLWILTGIHQKS